MTDLLRLPIDFFAGWLVWSLTHNLGHRWWHDEMEHGKTTFYAKGEREHHRIYDEHGARQMQLTEDPGELFISFPLPVIAGFALVFVGIYAWIAGWTHACAFGAVMYASMVLDHQLHILFHKRPHLSGTLGRLQQMHILHHATHDKNYFFVSGYIWDVLFHTAKYPDGDRQPAHPRPAAPIPVSASK